LFDVFSLFVPAHTQGKKSFALAPNGAIGAKLREIQKFDNIFFWESGRRKRLKFKEMGLEPASEPGSV
jgi:hypothetical protein